jgi:hypothetical protein
MVDTWIILPDVMMGKSQAHNMAIFHLYEVYEQAELIYSNT